MAIIKSADLVRNLLRYLEYAKPASKLNETVRIIEPRVISVLFKRTRGNTGQVRNRAKKFWSTGFQVIS